MYTYKALVIKAYDADTITVALDLGFKISLTEKLRLYGINAPEVRGKERELGLISRDRLREKIVGKEVVIKTQKDKKGKFDQVKEVSEKEQPEPEVPAAESDEVPW